jgi:hypothetical protein
MGVIDLLAALIKSPLQLISDVIRIVFVDPWRSSADYRTGFLLGLGVAIVVAYVSGWIRHRWANVLRYINATPRSFDAGPSPFKTSKGCGAAVIKLIAVLVLIIIVVIGLLRAIFGA